MFSGVALTPDRPDSDPLAGSLRVATTDLTISCASKIGPPATGLHASPPAAWRSCGTLRSPSAPIRDLPEERRWPRLDNEALWTRIF
jgi:hypothetical protein